MKINMIGSFIRNNPFGTEIAFAKGLLDIDVDVGTWDPSRNGANHWHSAPDAVIMFKDHGERSHEAIRLCKEKGAVAIEYQPDDIRAPGIRDMMKDLRSLCDYAFTFDSSGAKVAEEELGYLKARKLLVTADPDLYYPIKDVRKDIDFCFIGSLSNPVMHKSRNKMVGYLRDAGFNVHAQGLFDPAQINVLYNRSKVVLNHATDVGQDFGYGYGYQCRHFEVGFAGSCLFSNALLDDEGDGPQYFCRFNNKEELLWWAEELLTPVEEHLVWKEFADGLYEEMSRKFRPEHRAKEIIEFIEEIRDD